MLRLDVRGISKRYGAIQALDNVDFELRAGEVMALLGENGAGKSTLVKVLSGLVTPDSGEITIDGESAGLHTAARSQAAGIAVVQQEYSTIGCLTVAENLLLGNSKAPVIWRPRELGKNARELLDEVGLEHVSPSSLVEDLSVAEMQLLEVARVLARDAKIVIFDEPTAALSDVEIRRVLDVVRRLAAKGIGIIYVTHRLPEVFEIADRAAVFRNGTSLPPVDVESSSVSEIIQMMLGRKLEDLFPAREAEFGPVTLEFENLSVSGLRSTVSLQARRGEIIGLTGQLGSGASAVVRALAGALPIVGGSVKINGLVQERFDRRHGLANGIAYCSPDRKKDGIFAGVSILRNLSSPWLGKIAKAGFVSVRKERAEADLIATQFAIDRRRMGSTVGTLSGGNQQKVALSKWLGGSPSILLVEEPTRGVDVGARSDIYARLRALCSQGMVVVVSSSDTAEVLGLCDTVATFYDGRMTAVKHHSAWTEGELVKAVMNREVVQP